MVVSSRLRSATVAATMVATMAVTLIAGNGRPTRVGRILTSPFFGMTKTIRHVILSFLFVFFCARARPCTKATLMRAHSGFDEWKRCGRAENSSRPIWRLAVRFGGFSALMAALS